MATVHPGHTPPPAKDTGMGPLDHSFGHMLILGYLSGFFVVFGLVFALFRFLEPDIPWGAALFAALAVAVQAGIMGAVIAIGPWTARHEHDFYH